MGRSSGTRDRLTQIDTVRASAKEQNAQVTLADGSHALLGNSVSTRSLVLPPVNVAWNENPSSLHTLVFVGVFCKCFSPHSKTCADLGPPSNSSAVPLLQWLVANIPTGDRRIAQVVYMQKWTQITRRTIPQGTTIAEYLSAMPVTGGASRLVFLLYEQRSFINDPELGYIRTVDRVVRRSQRETLPNNNLRPVAYSI